MKGLLTLLMIAGIAAAAWCLPGRARHHYSETGVVYTTNYLTLQLPGGVVGFPPGTRLVERFNVHVPDREVVSNGKYTLAVDPLALTHDVEYAQDLADADQLGQDQNLASLAQRKARSDANQHAAELVAASDIDGINASLASSAVGTYDTALNHPTSVPGTYGSYGGAGAYAGGGGGSSGAYYNNVSVTQNNFNGGSPAARGGGGGGAGPAFASLPGKVVTPRKPVTGLSTAPMNP